MDIRKIINEWDPYSLFPYAPENEYETEIKKIESFVSRNNVKTDLSEFIKSIFDFEDISKEKRNLDNIVEKIYKMPKRSLKREAEKAERMELDWINTCSNS